MSGVRGSGVRGPRLQVLADGTALPGVMAADVFANSHLAADRFRVRFAGQAADADALGTPGARLDVQASLDGESWTSLIIGMADSVAFDPVRGTLDVEGRDLSALLIEAQVGETFANQTASEIVQTVAARHGLAADVTPTATAVGRYYQAEHDRMTLAQYARATTEWDLLAWLAGQEGFELGMVADRLSFGPRPQAAVALAATDCEALELTRQLGLLRPIEVVVRSWGTRAGSAVEQTAQQDGVGEMWRQIVVRPNLSPEEAQGLAARALADLLRHAHTARLSMPGEFTLTARSLVTLSGAGPGWDRDYAVLGLDRHLDARRGFTQHLQLQGIQVGGMADGSSA